MIALLRRRGSRTAPPSAPCSRAIDGAGLLGLRSAALQRLHADWQARLRGCVCPSREDFDPVDMTYILGQLSLIDVIPAPLRFRYRVHGTEIAHRMGVDLTGRYVDGTPKADVEALASSAQRREPLVTHRDQRFVDGRLRRCETLVLPLSKDGDAIDQLMSGIAW